MKKTIKQRFFLSLCLLMLFSLFGGGNLAWAQGTTVKYTLDFTTKSAKSQDYDKDWTYSSNGIDWTINGAANNNATWAYVRTGGKTRKWSYYKSNSAIEGEISSLVLTAVNTHNKTAFTMQSVKLTVARDAAFNDVIDEVTLTDISTSMTFVPTEGKLWTNAYYMLYFTWSNTATSANNGMDVEKIDFYSAASTEPLPDYNVSWKVNGEPYAIGNPSKSVKSGERVTALPTEPAAIGSKVFVGWTDAQIAAAQSTEPAVLFNTPEKAPAVTGNVTYYAVFATGSVTSDAKSLSEITDGGVYHIVATKSGTNYYLKANQNAGAGKRGSTTDVAEAGEFILEGSGDTWAIKVKGTAYYMALNGTSASVTYQTTAANYTVTDETNAMKFVSDGRLLCLNGSATGNFGSYAINTSNPVYIWLEGIVSYTDYVTTISTSAATVTFDAGTNGTCATESLTETSAGAGVTLPACVANDGYQFVGWSTSETPTSADAGQAGDTYYPGVDCTLYAYYKQLYTVTIEEPANGTIEVKHGENEVTSGKKFLAGDVLTITATPDPGYKFKNLQVKDGTTHTYTASNVKEWTMTDADITITANFDEITYSTITKMVNGVPTPEQVENGTEIPFTDPDAASIPTGYVFMGWTETPVVGKQDDAPTLVSSPVKASTDATYYAVFAVAKETTVVFDPNTVESNSGLTWEQNGITLKLSSGQLYTKGTPKTFTVDKGSANNFTVTSTVGNLKKLTATISGTKYKINSSGLTSGAKLTTNSITQTITFTQDLTEVVCPATSSNQIRLTKLEVQAVASPTDYCTTIPDVELAVGATSYATLYYSNFDLVVPENTEAYTFRSENGALMESATYAAGTVIPAGEAVVVYTTNAVPCTLNFRKFIANVARDASSQLAGTDEEVLIAQDDNYYFYGLSLNSSNNPNSVGFYWMEDNGAAFKNGAHKAYLKIPTSEFAGAQPVRGFAFKGTATGVESVESSNNAPQAIYDLTGRRVSKAEKGIYIINGKKVIK